jgi:hypothetical protein
MHFLKTQIQYLRNYYDSMQNQQLNHNLLHNYLLFGSLIAQYFNCYNIKIFILFGLLISCRIINL